MSDPNDPGYITEGDKLRFKHKCDLDVDLDVDMADLALFCNEWLWMACWKQSQMDSSIMMMAMGAGAHGHHHYGTVHLALFPAGHPKPLITEQGKVGHVHVQIDIQIALMLESQLIPLGDIAWVIGITHIAGIIRITQGIIRINTQPCPCEYCTGSA